MKEKPVKADLPPGAAEQIDRNLQLVYRDLLDQEVPDRFKALLAQLRQKDGKA